MSYIYIYIYTGMIYISDSECMVDCIVEQHLMTLNLSNESPRSRGGAGRGVAGRTDLQ